MARQTIESQVLEVLYDFGGVVADNGGHTNKIIRDAMFQRYGRSMKSENLTVALSNMESKGLITRTISNTKMRSVKVNKKRRGRPRGSKNNIVVESNREQALNSQIKVVQQLITYHIESTKIMMDALSKMIGK